MNHNSKNVFISDEQYQILYGTLLGDGSLNPPYRGYKSSFFQMRHSIDQKEWFNWKAAQLSSLSSPKSVQIQKPDGFSKKQKLHYKSRALPCLSDLERKVNTNGKLDLSKPWLDELTPKGLMVWYLDDGGLMGRKAKLNTQGFGENGTRQLGEYLKNKWELPSNVLSLTINEKRYWYIQLTPKPLKRFLELIMPEIPCESMVYKTFLQYNDLSMQQDWITRMKRAMPQFVDEIDRLASKDVPFSK